MPVCNFSPWVYYTPHLMIKTPGWLQSSCHVLILDLAVILNPEWIMVKPQLLL